MTKSYQCLCIMLILGAVKLIEGFCVSLGTQEDHKRAVQQLEQEKGTLERKLGQTSSLLDEQVGKLKKQVRITEVCFKIK